MKRVSLLSSLIMTLSLTIQAQNLIERKVLVIDAQQEPIQAEVEILHDNKTIGYTSTDENGWLSFEAQQQQSLQLMINYDGMTTPFQLSAHNIIDTIILNTKSTINAYDEVVITGTLRPTSKSQSPVNIEVYNHSFFLSNPEPSLLESLGNINGIRPQNNCNVCNTSDIRINGLEGAYSMILIDGMPIVSGLATIYGLNGIPTSLIERIEVMKGPASTIYGSEAIGGIINVITPLATHAPKFSIDIMGNSWQELNVDIGTKIQLGKLNSLLGINAYIYDNPIDNNEDNFTDMSLQKRVSLFNKWSYKRPDNLTLNTAIRYNTEDRWGGEMNWTPAYRGSNQIYGESIRTQRWEWLTQYTIPHSPQTQLQTSFNQHKQDSHYGDIHFNATQRIFFGQLFHHWDVLHHHILTGLSYRYTYYDDNTVATGDPTINAPQRTHLPGIFIQDEWHINDQNTLMTGLRYDFHPVHKSILTPRINYRWLSRDQLSTIRASIGSGYRVAYIFTEDHAALTGAREVIIKDGIQPETSWNADVRFERKINTEHSFWMIDAGMFFTYFGNRILPDYDTHPNQIIYENLSGYGISQGLSMNVDAVLSKNTRVNGGWTLMDVYTLENNTKTRPYFTERFSAAWTISHTFPQFKISIDYTGNLHSPMKLPLLSNWDPRPQQSTWYSIQNLQIVYKYSNTLQAYAGVKNIWNWTPFKITPFLIARAHDPFDKMVAFDTNQIPLITPENPYGLSFDPSYAFASLQGRRIYLGLRWTIQ